MQATSKARPSQAKAIRAKHCLPMLQQFDLGLSLRFRIRIFMLTSAHMRMHNKEELQAAYAPIALRHQQACEIELHTLHAMSRY